MREVRHQLMKVHSAGAYDSLGFSVNGSTVTLAGQVAEPAVRDDAQRAVERVEGVSDVVNNIEVLAPSSNRATSNARIRHDVFHAIYDDSDLAARRGYSAMPIVHIVVGGGQVRLAGRAGSELDRNRILVRASEVPGVIDDLQVERK